MKIKDINNIINETLYKEVKNKIVKESEGSKKEVYHIKCEGLPIATFETEKEAKEQLPHYKHKHNKHKGELIIEKGVYESHDDMIDKLDEINDQLEEENINTNMKNIEQSEGNEFTEKLLKAKENGDETFEVDGKTYDVKECLQEMDMDEDEECKECGDKSLEEQGEDDYLDSAYEDRTHIDDTGFGPDYDNLEDEYEDEYPEDEEEEFNESDEEKQVCNECGGGLNEEGICNECSGLMWENEELGSDQVEPNDFQKKYGKVDLGKYNLKDKLGLGSEDEPKSTGNRLVDKFADKNKSDVTASKNLKDFMTESNKKKVRLTESEFRELLKNIVNEAMKGQPGLPGIPGVTVTKKAQDASKKENDGYMSDVEKKMKDYVSFDGNDNPEFPKQIGKGDKVAINNTEKQEEEKDKNFAGLQNLDYDTEPSENFKKRLKMAIEGDSKMGNAASKETVKADEKEKKGKQPENKLANTVDNPKAIKKLEKQIKNRKEDKDKRALYRKQSVPTITGKDEVNESKKDNENILNEEMLRMKRLSTYNQKTQ